jgi:membrane protease YdiL (CAAX protease family)
MLARLFVSADRRMAVGWRILLAVIAWFAMLVITEELIAHAAGAAVAGVAVIGGSIALAVFLRRRLDRRRGQSVRDTLAGLGLPRLGAVRGLLAGFALGAAAMGVVLAVSVASHDVHLRGNPHHLGVAPAAWLVAGQLVFFLGVGFTEELLFRGYILQNLGESMPLWAALVLSSVLFGLFHGLHASLVDLAEIAIGGLLLGLLRLATGTLWVLLLILIRRRDGKLSWRDRISESGTLPLAAAGSLRHQAVPAARPAR